MMGQQRLAADDADRKARQSQAEQENAYRMKALDAQLNQKDNTAALHALGLLFANSTDPVQRASLSAHIRKLTGMEDEPAAAGEKTYVDALTNPPAVAAPGSAGYKLGASLKNGSIPAYPVLDVAGKVLTFGDQVGQGFRGGDPNAPAKSASQILGLNNLKFNNWEIIKSMILDKTSKTDLPMREEFPLVPDAPPSVNTQLPYTNQELGPYLPANPHPNLTQEEWIKLLLSASQSQ